MKLHDFMQSTVYICSPERTLAHAATQMEAHNVGSLLVINDEKEIVGILTDRDLALAFAHHKGADTAVEEIMSRDVVTIPSDAGLDDAASAMDDWAIRRLPVTDDQGHLIGIICLDDLYRYLTQESITLGGAMRAQGLPHR